MSFFDVDMTTYPNLGFNPVPGVPDDVAALASSLAQATDSMTRSGALLDQMRDAGSGVWQGDAGDAFRRHFNGKLATDLTHAHQSLDSAVGVLRTWHGDLLGFKDAAARLDQEAAEAKQAAQRAQQSFEHAQGNPDLQLAGQFFNTQQDLQAAQARIDAAESALRDAGHAAQAAQEEVAAILRRAEELAAQHEAAARRYAQQLEQATHGLAPHKPGLFSSLWNDFSKGLSAVGQWVEQHAAQIHKILSTISAVAGLLALVTPPPVDAVLAGVAAVASIGALGMDLANPQFRHGIAQLCTGHFDKASLGAALTGVTDVLGAVPGAKLLAQGGKAAVKGAQTGVEVAESGETVFGLSGALEAAKQVGSQGAKNAGFVIDKLTNIPRVAEGLGRLAETGAVEGMAKFAGAGTADAGYAGALLWRGRSAVTDVFKDVKSAVDPKRQPVGAAG